MNFEKVDAEKQMAQVKHSNDNNNQTTLNNEMNRQLNFIKTQINKD